MVEYHPDSEESYWAQLQLGVLYLKKAGPDLSLADRTFSELISRADVYGPERQEVRFLALLGRACVADRLHRDKSTRDDIVLNELQSASNKELFQDNTLEAPQILLDFRDRMLRLFPEAE